MKIYFLAFLFLFACAKAGAQNETDTTDVAVFKKVEVEASFTGGDRAWRQYLERNVNAEIPTNNFAPPGAYTVIVQFIVDKDGSISDVKALTNHGFGMEEEVIRIIRRGPKWAPAIMNGKPVKAYRKQPVTFQVFAEFELSTYKLIAGEEKSVEVKVDRVKDEDVEVFLSSGKIRHDTGNKYIIKVDRPGKVILTVWITQKKKKREIGKVALEVK